MGHEPARATPRLAGERVAHELAKVTSDLIREIREFPVKSLQEVEKLLLLPQEQRQPLHHTITFKLVNMDVYEAALKDLRKELNRHIGAETGEVL